MTYYPSKGQNYMKKFVVPLLALLMLFGTLTLGTFADSGTDSIEFTAYEILYKIGLIDTFESKVMTENGAPYLHLTSKAGTYGNTEYVISFSSLRGNFNMLDYPYVKFEYRTDSPTKILDTTVTSDKGENWPTSKPSQVTDGEYHTAILNINDMFSVKDNAPSYSDGTSMKFRLKPLGSGSKALTNDYFYDIKYIAFFKTEAAARAHTYTYDSSNDEFISTKIDYAPLTSSVERNILSGSEELKQTILNSKSISPSSISGTVYYVSGSGDDSNDGTSTSRPLASLEAVNKLALEPGDGVFFERGCVFRGQLKIR